jgi:hypothetical protein
MTNGGGGRTEAEYASEMAVKLVEAHCQGLLLQRSGGGEKISALGGDSEEEAETEGFEEEENGDGGEVDVEEEEEAFSIKPDSMVLSYSPWKRDLAPTLGNQPVLVVGDPMEKVMAAAKHQGFNKAMHISEYDAKHPLLNPLSTCEKSGAVPGGAEGQRWNENFKAVLVFTDPSDVFQSLQLITDLLLSSQPGLVEVEGPQHKLPIYFSNPDVLWKTQFPFPRFGQGAFRLALEAVFVARLQSLGVSERGVQEHLSR